MKYLILICLLFPLSGFSKTCDTCKKEKKKSSIMQGPCKVEFVCQAYWNEEGESVNTGESCLKVICPHRCSEGHTWNDIHQSPDITKFIPTQTKEK